MVTIRSTNDIVLNLLDFYKTTQPDLNASVGSVSRDLLIDSVASQLSLLYDEVANISNAQSLRLATGSDLYRLAANVGATPKQATKSSGIALLTFSSIPAIVNIAAGSIINASNGITFSVTNGLTVDPIQINFYKSIATKYGNDLAFLNITDPYAVEVSVQATVAGVSGNIAKYSLNLTNIPSVSNVTNTLPFSGGSNQEDDPSFRNRVLAIFSGSNVGTALGYKNTVLTDPNVEDAIVPQPGDPLMTRDGTQVKENADGSFTIISEGTGGKVDVVVLGTRETQNIDSFIYRDLSNKNDPTDSANIFILGQIADDINKTITQKRIDDIANGALPEQPVDTIIEVNGTLSGANFLPKTVDEFGNISGNYELIKDTGAYAGSPWGFDKFHWISNNISFQEDLLKSSFNGQDNTSFTDVLQIPKITQNINITNENSTVSTDRSIITLLHTPASNITRVFNVNTGERYIIINQNLDGTGSTNLTGRIQISGNTLPSSSDILQVDYIWATDYDPYTDYYGKFLNNSIRPVNDSVDWGYSNSIIKEKVLFVQNSSSTVFSGNTKNPISSVISANIFHMTGQVKLLLTGNFAGRLSVNLSGISNPINTIEDMKLQNTDIEVYNTSENNGNVINTRIVIGSSIAYNVQIILPTDTYAKIDDFIELYYNSTDTFNTISSNGTFSNNQITIPSSNVNIASNQTYLRVNYISATPDILTGTITNFPITRFENGFAVNSNISPSANPASLAQTYNTFIQQDLSSHFFVLTNISSSDYNLLTSQIISVVRLSDGLELWNDDASGTISINTNGNYQLTLSGVNSPVIGDDVLIIFITDDIRRFQPFTFSNNIIKKDIQTLFLNSDTSDLYTFINTFTSDTNLHYYVIDNTSGVSLVSGTDGYVSPDMPDPLSGLFSSLSFDFDNISDLIGKNIRIANSSTGNNDGYYSIINYDISTNLLTIKNVLDHINTNQINVIRLADGKNLWNSSGTLDFTNNILTLPSNVQASEGDKVVVLYFNYIPLKQSPSRVSITISDQINNSGTVSIKGSGVYKGADILFTATNNGLQQNISGAMRTILNSSTIPSNISIIRLVQLENVSATENEVITVNTTYDITGTQINNTLFYPNEMIQNIELSSLDFILPSSDNNDKNSIKIGDTLKITFYYVIPNDIENIYFTRNGTLYSNKKFGLIDNIYISSGFTSSLSTKFIFSFFNQPSTGSRYTTFYNYLAPKQNERISITYNYNQLISDATFNIEASRPINADVLIRAAKQFLVDAIVNIVINTSFINSSAIVIQNVKDRIIATINTNKLGDQLSSSQIIAAVQGIDGVDRARIITLNEDGNTGNVLTLICQEDQYFVANTIQVNQESV